MSVSGVRTIRKEKGEVCYTHFGIAPREVGLAKSEPKQISEGHPHFQKARSMKSDKKPETVWWAPVPHGIVDANLNDTLKLFLWLCYDRKATWTYSVPEVAKTLNRSPQYIRRFVKLMIAKGAFKRCDTIKKDRQLIPVYSFHPEHVSAVIKSQLKARPENDPESDGETDEETHGETDGETPVSPNENDITKRNNEIDSTKIEPKGTSTGKPVEADQLKEMGKYLNDGFYTPSALLSSVPRAGFKVEKNRFQVPWGIDDQMGLTQESKEISREHELTTIQDAVKEVILSWHRARVPVDVVQKRLAVFKWKYEAGEIGSLGDAIGVLAKVSEQPLECLTQDAATPPGCMNQPGASVEQSVGDGKPSPSKTDFNSTMQR